MTNRRASQFSSRDSGAARRNLVCRGILTVLILALFDARGVWADEVSAKSKPKQVPACATPTKTLPPGQSWIYLSLWWKVKVHASVYNRISAVKYMVPDQKTDSGWTLRVPTTWEVTSNTETACLAVNIPESAEDLMLTVSMTSFQVLDQHVEDWRSYRKPNHPLRYSLLAIGDYIAGMLDDGQLRRVGTENRADFDQLMRAYVEFVQELKGHIGYPKAIETVATQAAIRQGVLVDALLKRVTLPSCNADCVSIFEKRLDRDLVTTFRTYISELQAEDARKEMARKVSDPVEKCIIRDPTIRDTKSPVDHWELFENAALSSKYCGATMGQKTKTLEKIQPLKRPTEM